MRNDTTTTTPTLATRLLIFGFMLIVLGHWAEHVFQAVQHYVLGWPLSHAQGALGMIHHGAADNEWLHWSYALFMLVGLYLLYSQVVQDQRSWNLWSLTILLQMWHLLEHTVLVGQFMLGMKPTSMLTALLGVPRLELHLFYNSIVTVVMLWAFWASWQAKRRAKDRAWWTQPGISEV